MKGRSGTLDGSQAESDRDHRCFQRESVTPTLLARVSASNGAREQTDG